MKNLFSKIVMVSIILCAKELLVLNEEVLIVIAFCTFLYLVLQYGAELISKELDAKATLLHNKFAIYQTMQEKTLIHLLNYHLKREELSTKIKMISQIKKLRTRIIIAFYKTSITKRILAQIEDTLTRFILNESITSVLFQQKVLSNLSYKTGARPVVLLTMEELLHLEAILESLFSSQASFSGKPFNQLSNDIISSNVMREIFREDVQDTNEKKK